MSRARLAAIGAGVLMMCCLVAGPARAGEGSSAAFALYLGPGYTLPGGPGSGGVGVGSSAAFAVYFGPGYTLPGGPGSGGVGTGASGAFAMNLGRVSEGFAASAPFALDTRVADPSFVTAPYGLTASLTTCGTGVELRWTETASDPTGFQIDAKVTGFPDIWYERLPTVGPAARTLIHQTNDGLARTYRVRAVRGAAVSAYSSEAPAPAPGLPGPTQALGALFVKSIGDGPGLRVHIMPPLPTTQWDKVNIIQIEQATSPDFDRDRILTERYVFEGSGERTLRFEGDRNRLYWFRAQIIPPCAQPGPFTNSAAVAPRYAPVLLVHGIYGNDAVWGQVWSNALTQAGYGAERVHKADLKPCGDTWMKWGEQLRDAAVPALLGAGKPWAQDECVDIIAHSQGGLAARYYVEWLGGGAKVRSLVMVATPNHGGKFAAFSSLLNNLGIVFPGCTPLSNDVGVRALGSNSHALRMLNFGNGKQQDGGCENTPEVRMTANKGSTEYFTIAGTGPSILYCSNPLLYFYCRLKEFREEDPGDCASDGIVKAQSVHLRSLPDDHHFRDVDIVGAGGTAHDEHLEDVPRSKAILNSQEIANWAVGLLRRTNAHDVGGTGAPVDAVARASTSREESVSPRREGGGDDSGGGAAPDSLSLLASVTDSLPDGDVRSHSAAGDAMDQLMVFTGWEGSTLSLRLRGPDSTLYAPADTTGRPWLHFESSAALGYAVFAVDDPAIGSWTAEVAAPPGASVTHYRVDWVAKGGGFKLVTGQDKDALQPGDTLTLTTSLLDRGRPIRALCSAVILTPAGATDSLRLNDDGLDGDAAPADGIYTLRVIAPLTDGEYHVRYTCRAIVGEPLPVQRSGLATFSVTSGPDLILASGQVLAAPAVTGVGRLTELRAVIHNRGFLAADSAKVRFDDTSTGDLLGAAIIRIPAMDSVEIRVLWTPQAAGVHGVRASATLLGSVEGDVSNNSAELIVPVAAVQAALGVDTVRIMPARFAFAPPRPNPFRSEIHFDFTVPRPARIAIEVFDLQGRMVRRVLDEQLAAGRYTRSWRGDDASGRTAHSGIFFVRMTAPGLVQMGRVVLIR